MLAAAQGVALPESQQEAAEVIAAAGVAQIASEHPGRPDSGRTSRVTRPYSASEKRHWSYLTVWQVRSPVAIPSPCVVTRGSQQEAAAALAAAGAAQSARQALLDADIAKY